MTVVVHRTGLMHKARELAETLLADLPDRWYHSAGVARRAEELAGTVPGRQDAEVLVGAAWLHDIGYAAAVRDTGFHPVDGARHLQAQGWPARLVALVAHHSEALCVADACGSAHLLAGFAREASAVADALTYADQTVGPNGRVFGFEERLEEMLRRHERGSPNAVAHPRRAPLLRAAVRRVEERIAAA
jgi:putative nucleotidyltransferase with HDIG domain